MSCERAYWHFSCKSHVYAANQNPNVVCVCINLYYKCMRTQYIHMLRAGFCSILLLLARIKRLKVSIKNEIPSNANDNKNTKKKEEAKFTFINIYTIFSGLSIKFIFEQKVININKILMRLSFQECDKSPRKEWMHEYYDNKMNRNESKQR